MYQKQEYKPKKFDRGLNNDLEQEKEIKELAKKAKELKIPHVIELEYPIQWGESETITHITIQRRLEAEDLLNFPAEGVLLGDMISLIPGITGLEFAKVKKIYSKDLFKIINILKFFLPDSQETGKD